jgi:hypothetical protein
MSLDWHPDRLAMQKVVGSSPIIPLFAKARNRAFLLS